MIKVNYTAQHHISLQESTVLSPPKDRRNCHVLFQKYKITEQLGRSNCTMKTVSETKGKQFLLTTVSQQNRIYLAFPAFSLGSCITRVS